MAGEFPGSPDARTQQELVVMYEYGRKLRIKRWSHWVALGGLGAGTLVLCLAAASGVFVFENPLVYLGLLSGGLMLLLGVGIFQIINWRCPLCSAQFHAQRNPRFCANCGVRLRE